MSRPPTDLELMLLAADALEPELAAELRGRLDADPALAGRFQRLRERAEVPVLPRRSWRIPPPGMGLTTRVALGPSMGPQVVRLGNSFQLRVPPPGPLDEHGVVLLREEDEAWHVVVPDHPERVRRLSEVARREGDLLCLDIVARGPIGVQRWAVALPRLPVAVGEGEDAWSALRRAVAARQVPVGAIDVEVAPR